MSVIDTAVELIQTICAQCCTAATPPLNGKEHSPLYYTCRVIAKPENQNCSTIGCRAAKTNSVEYSKTDGTSLEKAEGGEDLIKSVNIGRVLLYSCLTSDVKQYLLS